MRTVRLVVEYDGTDFAGWLAQVGTEGIKTVQGELEAALQDLTKQTIQVRYASRTDKGVHARGQVVAFDIDRPDIPLVGYKRGLTTMLPRSITIREADHVELGWDPRRMSRGKRYCYTYWNSTQPSALERLSSWWIRERLDLDAMREAGQLLLGSHDFSSFRGRNCVARHARRKMYEIRVERGDRDRVHLVVIGNAFVKNMVRIIAGTLWDVGRGRFTIEQFGEILEAKDRTRAGMTAPPQGLVLEEVIFDDRLPPRPVDST